MGSQHIPGSPSIHSLMSCSFWISHMASLMRTGTKRTPPPPVGAICSGGGKGRLETAVERMSGEDKGRVSFWFLAAALVNAGRQAELWRRHPPPPPRVPVRTECVDSRERKQKKQGWWEELVKGEMGAPWPQSQVRDAKLALPWVLATDTMPLLLRNECHPIVNQI